MHLYIDIDELMTVRGILYKTLLDSAQHRTPQEINKLSQFLEWLHAIQDAAQDGHTTITLHASPAQPQPKPTQP